MAMEKKDQRKILVLGFVMVVILIGLISWIINIRTPSKVYKSQRNVILKHEMSNDSTAMKKDSSQIKNTEERIMKKPDPYPKTEN
jgi:hypothetical protein